MISLFRKTFNLSGCEIAIDPDRSIYHQGDYIKCKISINGSSVYEQTADEITLILEESWRTSDGESSTTHRHDRVTRVVDSNVVLKPGSTFNYEFEAQLPPNCILSDSSDSLGWCLVVKIDVPRAKDPVERLSIEVIPHREFLAIQHTLLNTLKFEKKDTFFTSGKRFIPPAALKSELDCIDLDFYQDGINTKCELVFDLQEKSIADYFKTIVRLDKVKKEIIFSQSELLDENLKPKDHVIAKKLANEIEQVLKNKGN